MHLINTPKIMVGSHLLVILMLKILKIYQNFFIIKIQPTCCKSLTNSSCNDLLLTNVSSCFQNTCTIATELFHFQKIVITVMKMTFLKNPLKDLYYKDYKKIGQEVFKEELGNKLNNKIHNYETFEKNINQYLRQTCIKSKPGALYD